MLDSVLITLRQRPADGGHSCHTGKERGKLPSLCASLEMNLTLCDSLFATEMIFGVSLFLEGVPRVKLAPAAAAAACMTEIHSEQTGHRVCPASFPGLIMTFRRGREPQEMGITSKEITVSVLLFF